MADAVVIPQVQPVQPALRFLRLIPGVLLLAAIGYAGKLLEQNVGKYAKAHHWVFPNIEYVLWAILLGLLISNTVGVPEIFRTGVATYEFWLKAGIVLLGSRFLLGDILKLGGVSLLLVAIEITGAIAFMTFLGRVFKLKPKLITLLAVGSAVCGVSAIIATKGAIDADDEDSSFSIAAILALGALALFTFPLIGHYLHLGRRSHRGRRALFRRRRKIGRPREVHPQRHDRLRRACLRHLLGQPGPSQSGRQQSRVPLAEVPQVCPGFPFHLRARHLPVLQQRSGGLARQSLALGLSAHLRWRRPSHEFPRHAQTRPPPLRRRSHRRSRDRRVYSRFGGWSRKTLRLLIDQSTKQKGRGIVIRLAE
jgi:hypothetical protein